MPKRVLLIGLGRYALGSSVPVLVEAVKHRQVEVAAIMAVGRRPSEWLAGDDQRQTLREAVLAQTVDKVPVSEALQLDSGAGQPERCSIVALEPPQGDPATAYEADRLRFANEIEAEMVTKIREAIDRHQPDGAVVSTLSRLNAPALAACLEGGIKHVLVEKPVTCPPDCCLDIDRAADVRTSMESLAALAARQNARVVVGTQRRYEGIYIAARSQLAEGGVPLNYVHAIHMKEWGAGGFAWAEDVSWRRRPEWTGGKIMHSGYHAIDIVTWWLRSTNPDHRPARVTCRLGRFPGLESPGGQIESSATIVVEMEARDPSLAPCQVTFELSLWGPGQRTWENYTAVRADQLRVSIDREAVAGSDRPGRLWSVGPQGDLPAVDGRDFSAGNREPTRDWLEGMLAEAAPNCNDASPLGDHLVSASIVAAAYRSGLSGQTEAVR